VLNGSGVTGQAGAATRALRAAGFTVTSSGAADSYHYATTIIRYASGQEAAANLLASSIVGGAQTQATTGLAGGPLVLVTGASYGGIALPGGAPGPSGIAVSAPTTAPTTTTTLPPTPGTATNPVPPTCR
jgi:hypothetical protein